MTRWLLRIVSLPIVVPVLGLAALTGVLNAVFDVFMGSRFADWLESIWS